MVKLVHVVIFGAAAIAAVSLSAVIAGGAGAAATRQLTSVQVLSDRLEPLQGAAVRLREGEREAVLVADAEGQTPWAALRFSGGVELTLLEKVHPGGIALGMLEREVEAPAGSWSAQETELLEISRTQPFAVQRLVSGDPTQATELWPDEGDHPHWTIVVPKASRLRFGAHVASL